VLAVVEDQVDEPIHEAKLNKMRHAATAAHRRAKEALTNRSQQPALDRRHGGANLLLGKRLEDPDGLRETSDRKLELQNEIPPTRALGRNAAKALSTTISSIISATPAGSLAAVAVVHLVRGLTALRTVQIIPNDEVLPTRPPVNQVAVVDAAEVMAALEENSGRKTSADVLPTNQVAPQPLDHVRANRDGGARRRETAGDAAPDPDPPRWTLVLSSSRVSSHPGR